MTHPFTPNYIAMAKAAEELQWMQLGFPHPPRGDWFLYEKDGSVAPSPWDGEIDRACRVAWLPRLDQVLGMLGGPDVFMDLAEDFNHDWVTHFEEARKDWHELAIALVMREKHGKRWDGAAWVT